MDAITPVVSDEALAADVAVALEHDIITLRLPPGARLIEAEIGRRFAVSRSPIREAVRLLEADGLVRRARHRTSVVAPMSLADLDAVCACRVPLEALASAGAATLAPPSARAELDAALADMEAAREAGDTEAAFAANVRITGAIHAACGNPVLQRLLSQVNKQALRYRYLSYRRSPELVGAAVTANRALVQAIASRDATVAHEVTEQLVRRSWLVLQRLMTVGRLPEADETAPI